MYVFGCIVDTIAHLPEQLRPAQPAWLAPSISSYVWCHTRPVNAGLGAGGWGVYTRCGSEFAVRLCEPTEQHQPRQTPGLSGLSWVGERGVRVAGVGKWYFVSLRSAKHYPKLQNTPVLALASRSVQHGSLLC